MGYNVGTFRLNGVKTPNRTRQTQKQQTMCENFKIFEIFLNQ